MTGETDHLGGFRKPRLGERITTLQVKGVTPIVRNASGLQRPSYRKWLKALDKGSEEAARTRKRDDAKYFSVCVQLRLFATKDRHADLDNFVKPILDAMARQGVFGPTLYEGSSMTGDERVDHLELTRVRVESEAQAGVLAEVWSLSPG